MGKDSEGGGEKVRKNEVGWRWNKKKPKENEERKMRETRR